MTTLDRRVDKLEAIVDPKPLEPIILYCNMTEAECAKFNERQTPGNPLTFIVRPYPEKEQDEFPSVNDR